MLRKTVHIVLALFLLVATAGVTISMHYCGGRLVSASLAREAKPCCSDSGGCCENKTLHFEVRDDFNSPARIHHAETLELDVFFPVLFVFNPVLSDEVEKSATFLNDPSPPPTIQTRLALLQTYLC